MRQADRHPRCPVERLLEHRQCRLVRCRRRSRRFSRTSEVGMSPTEQVMVELGRHPQPDPLSESWTAGFEMTMVAVDDSPDLVCGAEYVLDDDPHPWTVYSVHRCVERPDGTYDHERCFV